MVDLQNLKSEAFVFGPTAMGKRKKYRQTDGTPTEEQMTVK